MRPTWKKVYGPRDPAKVSQEFTYIGYDVSYNHGATVAIQSIPITLTSLRDLAQRYMEVFPACSRPFYCGVTDVLLKEEPISQAKINRVFGLTKSGQNAQLQTILDKVKRHT